MEHEFKAGQWVRVVRAFDKKSGAREFINESHPLGVVRKLYLVDRRPISDEGTVECGCVEAAVGAALPLCCVEPWVPRPGERVKGAVLEYVVVEDDGYRPWQSGAVCVPARNDGVLSWPCLGNLSPVLTADGFPVIHDSRTANAGSATGPATASAGPPTSPAVPPASALPRIGNTCACGAALTETLFSRSCESGHVGADTYSRVEVLPTIEIVDLRNREHGYRAVGGYPVSATREGALAAWRASQARQGRRG